MVQDFLDRKGDRTRYQVFVNTTLAELWVEQGETPDEDVLYQRREEYPWGDDAIVPQRGLFLTAAVDVQENPPRLEVEVVAWGRGCENWSVDYRVIQAFADAEKKHALPVTAQELWDELDLALNREYRHASGQMMPVMVMAIDTGKRPKPVYEFALKHAQPAYGPAGLQVIAPRTVAPIKGSDDAYRVISSVSKEDASRKRQGVRIVGLGTHRIKGEIYDLLRHARPSEDGSAVAGCYHFPKYEKDYFAGVCSEKRVVSASGVKWEKRPNVRNEPFDLKVYNRGAATIFGIDDPRRMGEAAWRAFEEALKAGGDSGQATGGGKVTEEQRPEQRRESWVPRRDWFRK